MLTSLLSAIQLIGPKVLGCLLVLSRPGERRAFGGTAAVLKGMGTEILLSAALAPVLMIANTKAVFMTLRGRDTGWRPQQREAVGVAWRDAFRAMSWQMAAGLGFVAALCVRPDLSICFAPIVLPLLFAAPLAVLTSRPCALADVLKTPDDLGVSATPVVFRANLRPATAGHGQDAVSALS
jgi:membrane glycosyltransferase